MGKPKCLCQNRGMVKIGYSDEPVWDLAICRCPHGRPYRELYAQWPLFLREWAQLIEEQQIGFLEDWDEAPETLIHQPTVRDVRAAGRTARFR